MPVRYSMFFQDEALPIVEPMNLADEALCKIKGSLNRRRAKMLDVVRAIDASGDGVVSASELEVGLLKLGISVPGEDLEAMVQRLDKDGSGGISVKEFDRALKSAEKKARSETAGRAAELQLETLVGTAPSIPPPPAYDWSFRKVRTDDSFDAADEQFNGFRSSHTGSSWRCATAGPKDANASAKLHSGSLWDSSMHRQRVFDVTHPTALPPALNSPTLPTYKTVHRKMLFEGRFGLEPVSAASDTLHREDRRKTGRNLCLHSVRGLRDPFTFGGVRKFENSPLTKSTVAQVVFSKDVRPLVTNAELPPCPYRPSVDDFTAGIPSQRLGR